ncbi:type 4a pilus biogenesis protein PilO [Candidatus Daviesbacteria bacterium]|nr:type 4a pilus biogenesis protein PilO [Candidatus Daviesbacteria bacterium]
MKKEEIIKFYQTYKLFLFPTIVALSCLFLIVFVIYPQISNLISNQKNADELMAKSKILETKVIALESLNQDDLSAHVRLALESLPPERDYGGTLGLLQQLVSQAGFSLTSISLNTSSNKSGNINSFPVQVEVKGARIMFQTLLNNLEGSSRLIRVSSFDVSSGADSQIVDASLKLDVLYAQVAPASGGADAPLAGFSEKESQVLSKLAESSNTFISAPSETGPVSPRGKANPFE